MVVPDCFITEQVELKFQTKTIKIRVYVVDILSTGEMLVGMDVLNQLQVHDKGLPYAYFSQCSAETPDIPFEKSSYIPEVTPVSEEDVDFVRNKELVLSQIVQVLESNKAIDQYIFCNIPEAEVLLPTNPGETTYRRQWPIPER
ncbi:hypothetical protein BB559_003437 [Furculomyces boomerangus]|uniref:Uncharacterized protein n=1 Tax=Furculomyces boomerangus TaxID=61424 RepID=A0A2T9YL92_9FUNG|nr:hypothetical protein BB559_003437 [Furculomyces boomerangus]